MSSTSRRTSVDGWSVPRGRSFGGPISWAGSVTSTRSVASLSSSSARASSAPGGERRLDRLAHGIERHAALAIAHVAQRELQRAPAAEIANPDLGERGERPRLGSGGERLLLEVVGIHCGDLIQRFLLLSRARERRRLRPGSYCGGDDAR